MDMGVLVGEEIKVLKMAPLGDPIEGAVKSYSLSLRKKEAESKGYSIDVAGIETMLGITVVPTSAVKKKAVLPSCYMPEPALGCGEQA